MNRTVLMLRFRHDAQSDDARDWPNSVIQLC